MHSLLVRIPEGVQPMLQHLEAFIVQTGVDDMKACAEVIFTDSEKYMEELLKLFYRFSTLVKEAFKDDPRFLTTRDKVWPFSFPFLSLTYVLRLMNGVVLYPWFLFPICQMGVGICHTLVLVSL